MKLNLDKIRRELDRLQWTYSNLAVHSAMERQFVSEIMAGKAGRTFRTVERLAEALNVDEKDLVI